ncbi:hybrid sensor histidine kinase/response regulator [Chloracidobacterium thermophilum]|jgi:signal transduction histidine kinase/CheY-like chemotaxis protein|uniref:histidine kinase n=1 Tax=Chloracidobacterium thermophilum (strain B) TaxID=981222 RepID=G2LE96_CHLTF|nr:ATP-binding protein [Chloracidobacterium thermophilum]AEP11316.1 Signal transduction histidine kinase [Chloracidobacterium thermophilum B]QUV79223.1 response regulator [Chloracidobacterium thermophilum]
MSEVPVTTESTAGQAGEEPPLHGRLHYKILLTTLLCAAPLIFGVDYLFYRNLRRDKIAEQSRQLQHIAATVAVVLDVSLIPWEQDAAPPVPEALRSRLRDLQRANELEQPIDLFYRWNETWMPVFTDRPPAHELRPEAWQVIRRQEPLATDVYTDQHGTWISAYAPLRAGPESPVVGLVAVHTRADRMNMLIIDHFKLLFLEVTLTGLFIIAFFSLILRYFVTQPLGQLLEGVRAMARRDYTYPIPTTANDELGALARAFVRTRETLQHYVAELESFAQTLEEKVEERSIDLMSANQELLLANSELYENQRQLRKINEDLRRANLAVMESNRLKSEFVANMSHELRTPLNAIIGYTSLLQRGRYGPLSEAQMRALTRIAENSTNLLELINTFLDFSKIAAGKMEIQVSEVDLVKFLSETITPLEALARAKSLTLSFMSPPQVPSALTDPARLRQIVTNLVSNALKFTEQGSVTVVLDVDPAAETFTIEVRDTGIGIAEKDLPHIFEEFRQVDGSATRKYGGTGLGLSIARKNVLLLDGTIEVESEVGKGSVFRVRLPLRLREHEKMEASEKPIALPCPAPDNRIILCIDDEPDLAQQLKTMLDLTSYTVISARNVTEGLELTAVLRPRVVVLDLILPGISGLTYLERLAEDPLLKHIPVIVVSQADRRMAQTAFEFPMVIGYHPKPLDRTWLLNNLQKIEQETQLRRQTGQGVANSVENVLS